MVKPVVPVQEVGAGPNRVLINGQIDVIPTDQPADGKAFGDAPDQIAITDLRQEGVGLAGDLERLAVEGRLPDLHRVLAARFFVRRGEEHHLPVVVE